MVKFGIDVQKQLISLSMDDFTPNATLPHVLGGQYGNNVPAWREIVIQFLCDSLRAGLISALPGQEGYHLMGVEEVRYLLREGDYKNGFDASLVWDVIHFMGTSKLRDLLSEFGLDNWSAIGVDLCPALGAALVGMGVAHA